MLYVHRTLTLTLTLTGYSGLYVHRTPWELVEEGSPEDGVAIFWARRTMTLEEHSSALYRDLVQGTTI